TRLRRAGGLHAPELLDLEILQVLRRLVAAREISSDRAELALTSSSAWRCAAGRTLRCAAPSASGTRRRPTYREPAVPASPRTASPRTPSVHAPSSSPSR